MWRKPFVVLRPPPGGEGGDRSGDVGWRGWSSALLTPASPKAEIVNNILLACALEKAKSRIFTSNFACFLIISHVLITFSHSDIFGGILVFWFLYFVWFCIFSLFQGLFFAEKKFKRRALLKDL